MKYGFLVVIGVLALGSTPSDVLPSQATQKELNAQADKASREAEAEMNRLLAALETKAKTKPGALAILTRAQEAWLAYRDAQLAAEWPFPNQGYGSVFTMCELVEHERLTRIRAEELRRMLIPTEGDVCGSPWPH